MNKNGRNNSLLGITPLNNPEELLNLIKKSKKYVGPRLWLNTLKKLYLSKNGK